MTRHPRMLAAALLCLPAVACGRPQVAPTPPRADLVVLLPDPEDGRVGRVSVTGAGGAEVELTEANQGTRVVQGEAPSAPAPVAPEDLQRLGSAMEARPLAPQRFVLHFETGSDTLTPESQALVPEIVTLVRSRPAPDVTVIGHTDTTGDAAANVQLGLQRATLIRDVLVSSGLDPARVEVASHGEADPLVPTADNVADAKNRRVEVTVR